MSFNGLFKNLASDWYFWVIYFCNSWIILFDFVKWHFWWSFVSVLQQPFTWLILKLHLDEQQFLKYCQTLYIIILIFPLHYFFKVQKIFLYKWGPFMLENKCIQSLAIQFVSNWFCVLTFLSSKQIVSVLGHLFCYIEINADY